MGHKDRYVGSLFVANQWYLSLWIPATKSGCGHIGYPRHFFPLNPIHALNILLAEMQLFLCKVSNFIVTFQEKGGKKWEYDEFFFQNQENAGESGSIAALRELSQPDQERQSIFLENKVNDFST